MDYTNFLKSKRIAERWGEAQAAFEAMTPNDELMYYQQLLTEFYDYIQELEARSFNAPMEQIEPMTPLTKPSVTSPPADQAVSMPITDEENPWFGFD